MISNRFVRCMWAYRKTLSAVFIPVLLLPLPLVIPGPEARCGYLLMLMSIFWVLETVPLGVTGLIPVFLAPMLGLLSEEDVCSYYLNDTTMMFTGGLCVALAIEESMLHKRIAMKILLLVGTKPQWLMFGFMLPTWFLSMWISNTATTAMMFPIMEAVLNQLSEHRKAASHTVSSPSDGVNEQSSESVKHILSSGNHTEIISHGDTKFTEHVQERPYSISDGKTLVLKTTDVQNGRIVMDSLEPSSVTSLRITSNHDAVDTEEKDFQFFCKGMCVCVPYAAACGGLATLTGTGPNLVLKGYADELWKQHGLTRSPVSYGSWLVIGMGVAVLNFFLVWIWLMLFYCGRTIFQKKKANLERERAAYEILRIEYDSLGQTRFEEVVSGFMFFVLVLLWFFQSPGFMTGWADLPVFKEGYIDSAAPAILITVLLFIIPRQLPWCGGTDNDGGGHPSSLLTWSAVHKKFPWSLIFLLGGGFVLAGATEASGLSIWIGDKLSVFGKLPGWACVAVLSFIVALMTEVTSNVASATILMPIVSAMAETLGYNPLYFMFPASLACSLAFMLPVATPPNAIAFSYGRLEVLDMIKAGAILNILCIIPITLAVNTWGYDYFELYTTPWKDGYNATSATL